MGLSIFTLHAILLFGEVKEKSNRSNTVVWPVSWALIGQFLYEKFLRIFRVAFGVHIMEYEYTQTSYR
jgi:hypothetical protein